MKYSKSAFRIAAKRGTTVKAIVDAGLSGLCSDLPNLETGDHEMSLATVIIGWLIVLTAMAPKVTICLHCRRAVGKR
jgi:hypothetical protein